MQKSPRKREKTLVLVLGLFIFTIDTYNPNFRTIINNIPKLLEVYFVRF